MKPVSVPDQLEAIAATVESDPHGARVALLQWIGGLVDAPCGLYYNIVLRGGAAWSIDVMGYGPEPFLAYLPNFEGICLAEASRREDGTEMELMLENPFFKEGYSVGETVWLEDIAVYRDFFKPYGLRSILGSYFFIDGRLAGWAGVYRTMEQSSYSRWDLDRVKEHEPRLLELFAATSPCNRFQLPENGTVGLLDEQGNVVQACANAPEWFAQGRICGDLRLAAQQFLQSDDTTREVFVRRHCVTLTRLVGAPGSSVYVHILPTRGVPVPALAALTRRQRAVAQAIQAGATIQEAVRDLHLSPETVRSHLKAIYEIFGVSTRVELARVLEHPREL
jgi:DNA-binding CsgD family transcriptional regulator